MLAEDGGGAYMTSIVFEASKSVVFEPYSEWSQ